MLLVVQRLFEAYPEGTKTTDSTGRVTLHLTFLFKAPCIVIKSLAREDPKMIEAVDQEG
jgi:hypothetical protein